MEAGAEIVDRQHRRHSDMDRLDVACAQSCHRRRRADSSRTISKYPNLLEPLQSLGTRRAVSPSSSGLAGGYGFPSRMIARLSDAIAVEKHGPPAHLATDSHWSGSPSVAGAIPAECQTTAWNASGMRSDVVGIDGRHDHACIGHLRRVAAIATDHADHLGADFAWRTAARTPGWG